METMKRLYSILTLSGALLLQAEAQNRPSHAWPDESGDPGGSKTLSPYFEVEGGTGAAAAFPLQKTEVEVQVSGTIADVVVHQVYANHGSVPIGARYVFPSSTRAAVHGMEMNIGGRIITAKIQEKQQAAATFTAAKSEGKTAALLDQKRPNVHQMQVANIGPGEEVQVTLHYSETISATDRVYEFVFPTVVGPRFQRPGQPADQQEEWVQNPYLKTQPPKNEAGSALPPFSIKVDLRTGMPVQSLKCVSHETDITFPDANTPHLELKPGVSAAAGNRDFVLRYQLADQQVAAGLLLDQGPQENFFWLTVQPPARVKPEQIPPREYLFILDVSGSMGGFPLNTAQDLVRQLIGSLGPQDSFNVMLFAGSANVLAPGALPASQENITKALGMINQQGGGGSTELLPALQAAFQLPGDEGRSRSIVLMTDGFVTCEKTAFDLVRKNLGRSNFFAFGIGSSVNRFLIEGLARAGRGEPFIVLEPKECAAAAQRFRDYVISPVLTDVKVEYEGFTVQQVEPAGVPDVFADRPVEIFGKWSGEPKGHIRIRGQAGREPVSFGFDVAEAWKKGATNPALKTLWARERIRRLSDDAQLAPNNGGAGEQREITTLGLTYHLLTEYTSFVAVDETPRPAFAAAQTVVQPLPLPQGVPDTAVAANGTTGITPEPGGFLLVTVAALLVLAGRGRRY